MAYRLLADLVVCLHVLFVLFVLFGGLLVLRWPGLARWHLPCAVWGAGIEIGGWICPLTYVENHLRLMGRQSGYATSFVEQYLLPAIYPDLWFPGGFPSWGFPLIGLGVVVLNGLIYLRIWRLRRGRVTGGGGCGIDAGRTRF